MDKINFFPNDLDVRSKKIILRLDLNVPIKEQVIKDYTRINLGIDKFGESAPYKEVYDYLDLSEEKITSFIQKKLRE